MRNPIAFDKCHPLLLDALALPRLERMQRLAFLIEQESPRSIGWRATGPVPLLGDLHATSPDLVAQFATVLCRAEPLELDVHWVERVVLAGLADRRVDDLLVILAALRTELCRQIDVLRRMPIAWLKIEISFQRGNNLGGQRI